MKYPVIAFMLICSVGWATTELKDNKLYINQEILDSFQRCNYVVGNKVWHTSMLSQRQGFLNSIWISDEEYGNLKGKHRCITQYKGEDIEIIVDVDESNLNNKNIVQYVIKDNDVGSRIDEIERRLNGIFPRLADLENKNPSFRQNESCEWFLGMHKSPCHHEWDAGMIDNFYARVIDKNHANINYPDTNPVKFEYCQSCKLYKATYKEGIKYWRDRNEEYHFYSWYAGSVVDVPFAE